MEQRLAEAMKLPTAGNPTRIKTDSTHTARFLAQKLNDSFPDVRAEGEFVVSPTMSKQELGKWMCAADE